MKCIIVGFYYFNDIFSLYNCFKSKNNCILILKMQIIYIQDMILNVHCHYWYTHCCFVSFLMDYAYTGKICTWKYHPTLKIQWWTIHIFHCVFLSNDKFIAKITSYSICIFQICFYSYITFLGYAWKAFQQTVGQLYLVPLP